MKDQNYVVIHGWMVSRLKLSGVEKEIYAIIYGFSQDGKSQFTGSIDYLQEWTGSGRSTVYRHLKELEAKGYIIKNTRLIGGYEIASYTCNIEAIQAKMDSPKSGQGVPNRDKDSPKSGLYNIVTDNKEEKDSSSTLGLTTTNPDVLFEDQVWSLSDIPEKVLNRIETIAKKRGLKEEDIPDFMQSLERKANHIKLKANGSIPGLTDLIDRHIENNFKKRTA